jgi:cytochrome c oxidase cbb3-type subunit III
MQQRPERSATVRRRVVLALLPVVILGCEFMPGRGERLEREEAPPRGVIFPPDAPIEPGPQPAARFIAARNPFDGDPQGMRDGYRYYIWYNCAGCHGALGGGGIGPPLSGPDYIYGGDSASLYQSIAQGRPQGMPAFGGITSEDMIWKMVAYIRGLARGDDVGPAPMQPTGAERDADIQAVGAPARPEPPRPPGVPPDEE